MFENFKTFETTYAGRPLVVETGKTCELLLIPVNNLMI